MLCDVMSQTKLLRKISSRRVKVYLCTPQSADAIAAFCKTVRFDCMNSTALTASCVLFELTPSDTLDLRHAPPECVQTLTLHCVVLLRS